MGQRETQLRSLFAKWKQVKPGNFIEDGLVNEDVWNASSNRLLVLLKEANSNDAGWTYDQFIRDKGYMSLSATWPNLIRWTYGILHDFPTFEYVEQIYHSIREQTEAFFQKVCFANVNKIAGGSSTTDEALLKAVEGTHAFLLEQIKVLEPTLVLCCSRVVFGIVRTALEKNDERFTVHTTDGGLEYIEWPNYGLKIVNYYHPGAYFPKAMLYTYLMNELKKL